jgi:FlaA1/EpsC-like NDP-sugar epimerase
MAFEFDNLYDPLRRWLPRVLQLRNRYFAALDLLLLSALPFLSLWLLLGLPWLTGTGAALAMFTALVLLVKLPVLFSFRLYARYWRYASIDELIAICFAVLVSAPLVMSVVLFGNHLGLFGWVQLPYSLPVLDAMLTLFAVAGPRFSLRAVEYHRACRSKGKDRRVLIDGAGDAGEMVLREMASTRRLSLQPVGFVDDDLSKTGMSIHGVRVLGTLDAIPFLVKKYHIQEVIIAMPTASGSVIRQAFKLCEQAGVPAKAVPGIYELLNGQVSLNRIRKVKIEDLLRREPVQVDATQVRNLLAGKRVLVTGAGGSIGAELCLQIGRCGPAQLVALGHGENSLFYLTGEIAKIRKPNGHPHFDFQVVLADIRDRPRLQAVFERFQPQIVFHAAAHKHVPITEENVEDAVTTNVAGTRNLVELSARHKVEHFVLISTDKAVNPVNVLGLTKRVAEMIVHKAAVTHKLPYVSVRFGNVLGSRGSVVPFFQKQIQEGGPVTVTDRKMTRFFMTIPEAVQLVLQAASLGRTSEVFVLDMGKPVRIVDLARDMIELSGLKPGADIEIVYTGLRPGEKLNEELFTADECPDCTGHPKIFVARNGVEYPRYWLEQRVGVLLQAARSADVEAARAHLSEIVCYKPAPRQVAPVESLPPVQHLDPLLHVPTTNPSSSTS